MILMCISLLHIWKYYNYLKNTENCATKKNPYYSSTHIPDKEEQRYIKYSDALYPVCVLYNYFNNIDKKE